MTLGAPDTGEAVLQDPAIEVLLDDSSDHRAEGAVTGLEVFLVETGERLEVVPDWILMGNVNTGMLQFTDREKIRESVRCCMEHGGFGKRYVFSTSNCIFDGMPPESYRVMLDEYRRLIEERDGIEGQEG